MGNCYSQEYAHTEGELDWQNLAVTSNNIDWNPVQIDNSVGKGTLQMQTTDKINSSEEWLSPPCTTNSAPGDPLSLCNTVPF